MTHEDAVQLISATRWCQFNLVMISLQLVGIFIICGFRR